VQLETRAGARVVGTVAALDRDSIHLRGSWPGATTRLAVADVSGYRRSLLRRDQRRGARTGARVGAIAGGAVLAAALYADATGAADLTIPTTFVAAPVAAALVLLGAGVGRAAVPERWTDRAALRIAGGHRLPGSSNAGIGLALHF
jgi:hypothetical protein